MMRLGCLLVLCAGLHAQDILVIVPPEFEPALKEWRAHREAQGHVVAVRKPQEDLRALVRDAHKQSDGKLRFVLLVGDVKQVPCAYRAGEVIKIWERDPRIANDNHLADLDGDEVPELAVGRIPADTAAEAATMLGKVVAYETNRDFSTWRRRLNMVAGVGGFGFWADALLEQVTIMVMRDLVPPAFDLHVTYANARSPFCPPPARVAATALERFNEGALLVAYFGHGSRTRLDRLRFKDATFDIFPEESAYALAARHGAPIVFFCACSTGHLDGAPDSLAEIAIKQAKGPVAIYAASRVSMPYANGVFSKELIGAIFTDRVATVGEALQLAKRRLMKPREGDRMRAEIEMMAQGYKPREEDRAKERAEHLFLYNLLGDPATRIPRAGAVALECAEKTVAGERLKVVGKTDVDGEVLVEFAVDRSPNVSRRANDSDEEFAANYERANAWVKASMKTQATDGRFEAELELPDDLNTGNYHVRVYVTGRKGAAMGARAVKVTD